jgi:hypothetical protein
VLTNYVTTVRIMTGFTVLLLLALSTIGSTAPTGVTHDIEGETILAQPLTSSMRLKHVVSPPNESILPLTI